MVLPHRIELICVVKIMRLNSLDSLDHWDKDELNISNELFRFQFDSIYIERTWCALYTIVGRVVVCHVSCVSWSILYDCVCVYVCVWRVNHKRSLLNCVDYLVLDSFTAQTIQWCCLNVKCRLSSNTTPSKQIEYNLHMFVVII